MKRSGTPRAEWALLAGLLCAAGCGGGGSDKWTEARPPTYAVRGTVLYNGEPVGGASVSFRSQDPGASRGAAGITNERGEFQLTTFDAGDGAVAGSHKVTVIKTVIEGADPSYYDEDSPNYGLEPPPDARGTTRHLVPERYASFDTTDLTATVSDSGRNEITLELED